MENIFYTALALHLAGEPVDEENVRAMLSAAGAPFDEPAVEAVAAFVDSLGAAHQEKGREGAVDPRIIRFLTSELMYLKVQTERLQSVLGELSDLAASVSKTYETISVGRETSVPTGRRRGSKEGLAASSAADGDHRGRYLYGVASAGKAAQLGPIGIEGNSVYTIPCERLCAVVHRCGARPYQSSDDGIVKNWVKTHQGVLDLAKEQLGTIIPMSFDTILYAKDDSASADQVVQHWLTENCDELESLLREVEGKDEYGVQVFFQPAVFSRQITEQSQNIRRIKEELATKSPGMAYLYKQKLEKTLKGEMDKLADRWFKDFYSRIRRHAANIVVEKTRKLEGDKKMLLNLSCLVAREKVACLGEELEEIEKMGGFSVHFSGPWLPYSFVARPVTSPGKTE